MAERTLKRRFKAATGLTLIDYLQNLRLEEAKRLLESSKRAVDAISADVGYEDASFFRRIFKRRTGLTPRTLSADVSADRARRTLGRRSERLADDLHRRGTIPLPAASAASRER